MSDQLPPPSEDPVVLPPTPAEPVQPEPVQAAPVLPEPVQPAPVLPPPTYPAAEAPAVPEAAPPASWPAAYPPPAYPVAGYPAPAAAAPQTSSNAIVALILAVVSWAVCPIIPAIVALVMASNASKEIAASDGRIQGQGLVTAAKVVSWVNIGVWAAVAVVGVFFLVLVAVAGMGDPQPF